MPQLEVTFDIDANGILNVSAKDLGTGKEQTIEIKGGSGLSDDEVQAMVSDAESHADEDRKAKELAEARNVAEQAVYQGDKQLADLDEQIDESAKAEVTKALDDLRAVVESADVDDIKSKTAALEAAFHKVSEQVYANAQAQQGPEGDGTNGGDGGAPEEEIVDAEVVEEDDTASREG
jgi:molecular chaperone DnaK